MTETLPDYRTRTGREKEVLAQYEIDGYLDTEWARENVTRLSAAMRLIEDGTIPRDRVREGALKKWARDDSLLARGARLFDGWWRAAFGSESV
jgi:hypothetical protein